VTPAPAENASPPTATAASVMTEAASVVMAAIRALEAGQAAAVRVAAGSLSLREQWPQPCDGPA